MRQEGTEWRTGEETGLTKRLLQERLREILIVKKYKCTKSTITNYISLYMNKYSLIKSNSEVWLEDMLFW